MYKIGCWCVEKYEIHLAKNGQYAGSYIFHTEEKAEKKANECLKAGYRVTLYRKEYAEFECE